MLVVAEIMPGNNAGPAIHVSLSRTATIILLRISSHPGVTAVPVRMLVCLQSPHNLHRGVRGLHPDDGSNRQFTINQSAGLTVSTVGP
jgi:hypothetical protein